MMFRFCYLIITPLKTLSNPLCYQWQLPLSGPACNFNW